MSTLWRKGVFESKTTHYIFFSNFLFRVFCFFERLCKERVGSDIEGLFMFGCCVGRSSQIVLWLEYTLCWSRVMLWFHHHNIEYTQTQLSASKYAETEMLLRKMRVMMMTLSMQKLKWQQFRDGVMMMMPSMQKLNAPLLWSHSKAQSNFNQNTLLRLRQILKQIEFTSQKKVVKNNMAQT